MKPKPLVQPKYHCQTHMDKLMSSQELLVLVEKTRERKSNPIIANSKANIGDTANKWKYNPNHLTIALNLKITIKCRADKCPSQSQKKSRRPNQLLPTLSPKPKINAVYNLLLLRQKSNP